MPCLCASGTPVCPNCWSVDIEPYKVLACQCNTCGKHFVNAYCMPTAVTNSAAK